LDGLRRLRERVAHLTMMNASELRDQCLSFAGAEETFPFGARTSVFKVGGKNEVHWNTVTIGGGLPDGAIRDMIEDSYDLVVSALPAAERRALG
jgi:predicted DNA-binding protein (MmcQ/YjbR family)